jgi:uncharacterized damage-inducible protein DinB
MTTAVALTELLDYSDHERRKWRDWLAAAPGRMEIRFQAGGRFPTIGSLFEHVFLVERRHLCRLEGGIPPDMTGVAAGDWKGLFDYADLVRDDLRSYLSDLDDTEARQTIKIVAQSATRTMTRRELITHIVLHEIRHLAQAAYAVRLGGQAPPGEHDVFYFVGTV